MYAFSGMAARRTARAFLICLRLGAEPGALLEVEVSGP